MKLAVLSTNEKALQTNLDKSRYGTFAEIGAGQEVARWFFHVGGASGTVAKTISAYDMTVSDAIYGSAQRYVSRERLQRMLKYEFDLLLERLKQDKGNQTRFFAFANTVTARSYSREEDGRGWMGIRFQTEPHSEPSEVIIHLRMLDKLNIQQQETVGVVGVNLIYAAYEYHQDPIRLLTSLADNLTTQRVEVDMVKFSGPAFYGVDHRLMSLELVRTGLADSAMFTTEGDVVQAAEILYKKPILVERGSFRPITNVTLDMLGCARKRFLQETGVGDDELVELLEMTLHNLTTGGEISQQDFLDRVDLLGALGKTVLISNYGPFYRLAAHLFRYTKKQIGLVMGMKTLGQIFEEHYYEDLEGGILESFGRLFKNSLKIYAYPQLQKNTKTIITPPTLKVAANLRHLYAHLLENGDIIDLESYNPDCLSIYNRDVLAAIRNNDPTWESQVPPVVTNLIKKRGLFGYKPKS